jgi:hypothetical protein
MLSLGKVTHEERYLDEGHLLMSMHLLVFAINAFHNIKEKCFRNVWK